MDVLRLTRSVDPPEVSGVCQAEGATSDASDPLRNQFHHVSAAAKRSSSSPYVVADEGKIACDCGDKIRFPRSPDPAPSQTAFSGNNASLKASGVRPTRVRETRPCPL